jgi:uncharacterized protein (TIGR02466 family)
MGERAPTSWKSAEVLRLFPTFVWKAQLARGAYEDINAPIHAALKQLAPHTDQPAPGTMWQSDHGLHKRPSFAGLARAIDRAVADVLAFLKVGYDAWEITGCWANVAVPGGWHRMHSHPNNFLSGVYYVQVQEGADTINFHDPRAQTSIVRPPVTELTGFNTDQVVVQVTVGTLLLFPAWLSHSVEANASNANRISVSFNVMFRNFAEALAKPLWGED